MEGAQIDSSMRQFLNDRKLDINAVSKQVASQSSETAAQRRERLRQLAIQKRVSLKLSVVGIIDFIMSKRTVSHHNCCVFATILIGN